ncbi:hypothetical protein TSAR_003599 [Trichomalopsis sarcophagae]|uniref:Uncharacterized protein n=1 Tax=Trichomalopsis sarcophagae TaxID=543379 RepID=A0A232EVW4_9HYME|nr:hypothetical protein TSAR_003599 [Trichomalopsis sarcophagae]
MKTTFGILLQGTKEPYADDIVMLAENREGLVDMCDTLKRLTKICWREMQKENFENQYRKEKYILDKIVQNIDVESEVFRRKVDIENQMINENIENSRYNVKYKEILCDKLPRYLKKGKSGKVMSVIARVRCVNFENANKYWLGERKKLCHLCGEDWGTFNHYIEECEKTIEWTKNLRGEKYERFNLLFKEERNIKIVNAIENIVKAINEKAEKDHVL